MTPRELFQAGQLDEAIRALGAEVRDHPTDVKRRTFLFELLCFAGEFDRAAKHLNLLADASPDSKIGAVLYHSALHGERVRQETFAQKDFPSGGATRAFSGSINGQPFESIEDADPRIGPRLELFAAGAYLWIGFEHIVSVEMQPPKRLRDLLWAPALVRTGPSFKDRELGEVLIPVLYPGSYRHADPQVRLGRATVWQDEEGSDPLPSGQKLFLVGDTEVPLLELRHLEFAQAAEAA